MDNFKNTAFIILAAGRGQRMENTVLPKPLQLLNNQPLISYILKTLNRVGVAKSQLWIAVHHQSNQIKQVIGSDYQYINQEELDGTAGALEDALKVISAEFSSIAVFQADDSMFMKPETIENFINQSLKNQRVINLITLHDQRSSLGSLIRDRLGQPQEIWPESRCQDEGLTAKELITGVYLFNRQWVSQAIGKLSRLENGEIGLPYLIEIAYSEKKPASIFELHDPNEWQSVNTPEELEKAEKRINPKL